MASQPLLGLRPPRSLQITLRFGAAMFYGIGIGLTLRVIASAVFAHAVKVDRCAAHFGPIIVSGRTTRLNVSSSTKPNPIASCFKVVPFLCAVFATVVALS